MRTSCRTAFLPILFATLLPLAMAAQDSVAGDWMVTVHEQFGPNIMRLSLVVSGDVLEYLSGRASSKDA